MQTLSIRVPDDVEEQIDSIADANGNTRSDQTRQLIRAGLDRHERGDTIPAGFVVSMLGALLFGSAIQWTYLADTMPTIGLLLYFAGVTWEHSTVRATIRRITARVTG